MKSAFFFEIGIMSKADYEKVKQINLVYSYKRGSAGTIHGGTGTYQCGTQIIQAKGFALKYTIIASRELKYVTKHDNIT